jgi:hypothetical protein
MVVHRCRYLADKKPNVVTMAGFLEEPSLRTRSAEATRPYVSQRQIETGGQANTGINTISPICRNPHFLLITSRCRYPGIRLTPGISMLIGTLMVGAAYIVE